MENNILKSNYNFLKRLENLIINEQNVEEKFKLLDFYSYFAKNNSVGTFHSPSIEYHLLEIAEKIPFQTNNNKLDKSLIIMTKAYKSGGHTRIVEHTIHYSINNKYDLLFTKDNFEIPSTINNICKEKECGIIVLTEQNILKKAEELRNIANKYKNIILHIHPEDYLPILAFGHSKWSIPIFYYNHAEHLFWFGISVADVVLDLSSRARNNSIIYRNVKKSELLEIPIIVKEINHKKNETLRKKLNIDKNSIVFLSAGSEYKFMPNKEIDFRKVVEMILSNFNNSYFIIIGINPKNRLWKKIQNKYQDKLLLIEEVDYNSYIEYINITNIYIDSMPVSGYTILLENAVRKIPIVFLDTFFSFPDSILKEAILYDNILGKVEEIIENNFMQNVNLEAHYIENYIKKLNFIIENHPKHSKNLNMEQKYDFSKSSIFSYILENVFKNKITRDKPQLKILSLKYKIMIYYYMIKEYKISVLIYNFLFQKVKNKLG